MNVVVCSREMTYIQYEFKLQLAQRLDTTLHCIMVWSYAASVFYRLSELVPVYPSYSTLLIFETLYCHDWIVATAGQ